jgi:cytochrome c oxidase subunit II
VLLLAACSGASPSTVDPKGSESREIAGVWWLMFGVGVVVYVVVAGLVIRAATRGRRHARRESRISDAAFIWIGGIIVPALILLGLGVVTVTTSNAIRQPDSRALRVEVTGVRWWWQVRYPDEGITTANELHVPVGRPIQIRLGSRDVIHSFWVPQLAGKVDTIPGQPNTLRFTAETAGTYLGECAEFCGLQHAHMGFAVIAESPGAFGRWAAREARPASEPTSELAARGEMVFVRSSCAGCHTVRGTPAAGDVGPDLTHVGSRGTLGARAVTNTPDHLAHWIRAPDFFKPGVLMPTHQISGDDVDAVVAYLEAQR